MIKIEEIYKYIDENKYNYMMTLEEIYKEICNEILKCPKCSENFDYIEFWERDDEDENWECCGCGAKPTKHRKNILDNLLGHDLQIKNKRSDIEHNIYYEMDRFRNCVIGSSRAFDINKYNIENKFSMPTCEEQVENGLNTVIQLYESKIVKAYKEPTLKLLFNKLKVKYGDLKFLQN